MNSALCLSENIEGHHMKSVEAYPELQGDADNIQLLSRDEHTLAHEGSMRNPTNSYMIRLQEKQSFLESIHMSRAESLSLLTR